MSSPLPNFRSHLTLALCCLLHLFTHAYGAMLVPLYFAMTQDLHLNGLRKATLVVTVYGLAYNLGGFIAGELADRFDRKVLLGIGLLGNAAAIAGIGLTRQYEWVLVYAVLAGVFGTIFHPTATALSTAHYPKSPGMAMGLLGIGSGLGFFIGPQYAGWRAQQAAWQWGGIAQWQKPCVELGVMGLIAGVVFLILSVDPKTVTPERTHVPLGPQLRKRIFALAALLSLRDFAGVAGVSLATIYVQKVFGLNIKQAGLMIGLMLLPSSVVNPTMTYLTGGRRRLPGLRLVMIFGSLVIITTPLWGLGLALAAMAIHQATQFGSYAISDAGIYERVSDEKRGRVAGMFLTVAGTIGALGPWVMGWWTDALGARATHSMAYVGPFALLAITMFTASFAPRLLARLGPAMTPPSLGREIAPETMETVL